MKRLSVLFLLTLLSLCASAQDIIVKKDGAIIKATVTKVSETEVEYRNFGPTSERIYILKAESILSINYEDGTVEKFYVQSKDAHEQESQKPENRKVKPDMEANRASIEAVNSSVASYDKNKPDKKAGYAILKLAVDPQSVLVSDELSISVETGSIYELDPGSRKGGVEYDSYFGLWQKNLSYRFMGYSSKPAIKFHVTNRTDHTLYLDLGNTFLSVGGRSVPYYIPGAQSTTSTSGKGAGVNLGAVAGALGVGGLVGTLAGGVTVGGGSSTSTNNIVYNQRVIAVASFSRISLEAQIIEDGSLIISYWDNHSTKIFYQEPMKQGEKVEFSKENSPLKLRFYLSYSSTENCDRLKSMEAGFYGQSIYGFGSAGGYSPKYFNFSAESLVIFSHLRN